MKLVQLAKFFPPEPGGIESVTEQIRLLLRKASIPSSVLAFTRFPRPPKNDPPEILRRRACGTLASLPISPGYLPESLRQMRRHDFVVFHLPNPYLLLAALLTPKRGRKWILWWHSDIIRQRFMRIFYRPFERLLIHRADAVVAASPVHLDTSDHASQFSGKRHIIPFAPAPIFFHPRPADRRRGQAIQRKWKGRPIVFACGRLVYYKGFEVLIEAAKRLSPETVVLIAGEGELRRKLQTLIHHGGLQERVHLIGEVTEAELLAHYLACRVFCLPSTHRSEMFGIVQIEAMALGRPVVSTDIPGSGVPWVNRHNVTGEVVPPGDAAALADSLTRILTQKARWARLARGAARDAKKRFHPDQIGTAFVRLIRALEARPR
ncbi:MAG: glycosyltransferase [Spirochaetes bacterium]|nr:glycosyltransferase [Spirochaetota bacterium]